MGTGHRRARFVLLGQAFLGRAQAVLAQDCVRCRFAGRLRHVVRRFDGRTGLAVAVCGQASAAGAEVGWWPGLERRGRVCRSRRGNLAGAGLWGAGCRRWRSPSRRKAPWGFSRTIFPTGNRRGPGTLSTGRHPRILQPAPTPGPGGPTRSDTVVDADQPVALLAFLRVRPGDRSGRCARTACRARPLGQRGHPPRIARGVYALNEEWITPEAQHDAPSTALTTAISP